MDQYKFSADIQFCVRCNAPLAPAENTFCLLCRDLNACAQCGELLTDDNQYLCDACTESAYCAGSDICEPWETRFPSPWIPRAIDWPAVVMLASFLAVAVGTWGWQQVQAQDATIHAPHAINGRIYEWPVIGTAAYSDSCRVVRFWEDGSCIAYCAEDGATYTFDPEDERWYAMSATR